MGELGMYDIDTSCLNKEYSILLMQLVARMVELIVVSMLWNIFLQTPGMIILKRIFYAKCKDMNFSNHMFEKLYSVLTWQVVTD